MFLQTPPYDRSSSSSPTIIMSYTSCNDLMACGDNRQQAVFAAYIRRFIVVVGGRVVRRVSVLTPAAARRVVGTRFVLELSSVGNITYNVILNTFIFIIFSCFLRNALFPESLVSGAYTCE